MMSRQDSARSIGLDDDRSPTDDAKKIILCFDGTNDDFRGDDTDTNVVKLFEMFNRLDKHQYHYYQPGIGTYIAGAKVRNLPMWNLKSAVTKISDQMFASSFADHILAGYKFLMRYYMEGDKVYIFGFSRGAYTARFLTELLNEVGLLSKGNEENLPFLWYSYSAFRSANEGVARDTAGEKVKAMTRAFCRKGDKHFVHFLGLWDCVNSVASFPLSNEVQQHAYASPNIALHVRHAVSCHERRVKFQPTLFLRETNERGSCEERWFAGNHGDIGGGWKPVNGMLLSDIPLIWMVSELREVEKKEDESLQISWRSESLSDDPNSRTTFEGRKTVLEQNMAKLQNDVRGRWSTLVHDVLNGSRNGGDNLKLMIWWLMEYLPIAHTNLTRQPGQNVSYKSEATHQLNRGKARRIPLEPYGKIHESVHQLYKAGVIGKMQEATQGGRVLYRYFDAVS